MKIRKGFVSNSSSSSFCIYGCQFSDPVTFFEKLSKGGDMQHIYKILNKHISPNSEPITDDESFSSLVDDWGYSEVAYTVFSSFTTQLSVYTGSEYNENMISVGKSWSNIGDKETGEEFRAFIEKEITALFGPDIECRTIEESFRC